MPAVAERHVDPRRRRSIRSRSTRARRAHRRHPRPNRHTLIRRVSLDLIGLPPTPGGSRYAFVNDPRPDAYERLVDRLLESEQYGERWARRWLDLARYADTNGYEKDRDRSVWPYRDWVIRALNSDMPFDRFTIEQIAGDMLPNATREQLVATGFHRNTMLNEEGGIDPLEFRFHAMTDRVATTGTTWLGLTLGCAQCHTHKYDPVTHRDYYSLMAFLNNADEPELDLPDAMDEDERKNRRERVRTLIAELERHWPLPDVAGWQSVRPIEVSAGARDNGRVLDDDSVLFAAPGPERVATSLSFDVDGGPIDRLRLDTLTHDSLPSGGPGRVAHGNFVLTEARIMVAPASKPNATRGVPFAGAVASIEQPEFSAANAIDGNPSTGWAIHHPDEPLNVDRHLVLSLGELSDLPKGRLRYTITLAQNHGGQHTIGRLRLSVPIPPKDAAETKPDATRETERRAAVDAAFERWLDSERKNAGNWTPLEPTRVTSNLPILTIEDDRATVFVLGDTSKHDTYEIDFEPRGGGRPITAVRLEALPDDRLPAHGPGMTYYEGRKGDFFLGEIAVTVGDRRVPIAEAKHSYAKNRFGGRGVSAALANDGDLQTGWSVSDRPGERHVAVFIFAEPVPASSSIHVRMDFGRHFASSLGKFRISATGDAAERVRASNRPAAVEALLVRDAREWTDVDRMRLREAFLLSAPELASHAETIRKLERRQKYPTTLVLRERPADHPRPYASSSPRRVSFAARARRARESPRSFPNSPKTLRTIDSDSRRWLVPPREPAHGACDRQPQLAGVLRTRPGANGRGLRASGRIAEPSRAPRLARGRVHGRWLVAQATPSTHRSQCDVPSTGDGDCPNASHATPRIVGSLAHLVFASMPRCSAIRSSRRADCSPQTCTVHPFARPSRSGVTEAAYGRPKWNASSGSDRYRRSVYTYQKRTAPFAMYRAFDAPSGESCVARRVVSNTPLQALTLLNDDMFLEAAQATGRSLASREGTDAARVRSAIRRFLIREPEHAGEVELTHAEFLARTRARIVAGDLDARAHRGGRRRSRMCVNAPRGRVSPAC